MQIAPRLLNSYYDALKEYRSVGAAHERAVKTAFHGVLETLGRDQGWTLVPEWTPPRRRIRVDGALRDPYGLTFGVWEAKDEDDDLEREIQRKIERGYPLENTIFQAPERALLYQDGTIRFDADLTNPQKLDGLLRLFFSYRAPQIERFHDAVAQFKQRIPELAAGLAGKIREGRRDNPQFKQKFAEFVALCREAVNPNISENAVEEMLIQHLLTERLFRKVFKNPDFTRRNVIAYEIEKVIDALTSRAFSRTDFLGSLDRFYAAIEDAAETISDYSEKQDFLNTVYEQFFQGFSVKVADTHGIVYTPQPIVDFMVKSVDVLLERHFGQRLGDAGVHILDPFVGTGNFIMRVIEEMPVTQLSHKYQNELHCNEVMLLPYYTASMNIEHAYFEKTGAYEPFEGIVLVDTFEMVAGKTLGMFSAENTSRAERQRRSPIKVILGNPPYNAHQVNANDANQNRKYPIVDKRVSETYAAASRAQNKNALSDPYVKAFRWASDRVGRDGIVAFISNGSFVDDLAFDGMRRHLSEEFDEVWIADLGGNVRKNPKLSGTTHNVFGIQVSVAITFLVRKSGRRNESGRASIRYVEAGGFWRKEQKYDWLVDAGSIETLDWREVEPNKRNVWLTDDLAEEWETFLPIADAEEKASIDTNTSTIFNSYSSGVKTGRDVWVYDFNKRQLRRRVERLVDTYNEQVERWQRTGGKPGVVDTSITFDDKLIKWSQELIRAVQSGRPGAIEEEGVRLAMYRPFVTKWLYFDPLFNQRQYQFANIFPTGETKNHVICVSDQAYRSSYSTLVLDRIGDLHMLAGADAYQFFPFYFYDGDGTRRENITDWSLEQYRKQYGDASITRWDIFHYVYAVLHHPEYRRRYAADLRRSLPRIPFAPDFRAFAESGKKLAELHVGYEDAPEYPLEMIETPGAKLDWRVEKMKWLDKEKTELKYNDFLTLRGIPPEAHRYRLGNRSALDWLVDQYRVKTDKRSGITHDPNTYSDDPAYIVKLIKKVTTVSVETVEVVDGVGEESLL